MAITRTLTKTCKKRCKSYVTIPLTQLDLSTMCVNDIYAYIRVYGSKKKLARLAVLGSRATRFELCKLYLMNI